MGDGPFRDPKPPESTPGRAPYGGLAPLVDEMGKGKPKSSDPYFTPPPDGGRGRGTPFLDPPAFKPGGEQPPAAQPPAARPPEQRPTEQPKWKAPTNTPDWSSKQPYSGGDPSGDKLKDAVGSKSELMVKARDVQRGSTTSKAIIAGTASGLLAEPMVKGMGLLADKGSALEGTGPLSRSARWVSNGWKSSYDPVGIFSSKIAREEELVTKTFTGIKETHALDKQLLSKILDTSNPALTAEESKHLVNLKSGLKIKTNEALAEALVERQTYLNPDAIKTLNAGKTAEHLTTIRALELSRDGGKILTTAERHLLETRQLALTKADEYLIASKTASTESKWFTQAGAIDNAKRSFLYTLGTGSLLAADHSVRDRMYGQDAKSWESSAFTVPLAVTMGTGFKGKALLASGALISGHVLDGAIEAPKWIPESYKHFSAYDAVPLGLAFAIATPSKSKLARTLLVGSAVIGGNALESSFTPASTGDVETTAKAQNIKDKTERTFSSYDKTLNSFKDLGKKNEIVLEQDLAQVLVESNKNYSKMSQEEKLGAHRTTAVLAQALGENRLEKGTRLSAQATDKPTYILDGLNMDMGGDSLAFLQMARNSVRGSKAMTEIMMGKQAYGTVVTEQEVKDLDRVADKVNTDIEAINGKHDIGKAMEKLKAFIDRGTTSNGATFNKELAFHKTFVDDINRKLGRNMPQLRNEKGEPNPDATMMVSKLLRDQALAKMAQAAYKLDHGNDPIAAGQMIFGTPQGKNEWLPGTQNPKGFDGALEAIMLAERLNPNNQDLPELKAIATRLADQIKAKIPDQYSNYKSNPWMIKP